MEIPYIVNARKDTGLFNSKIAIWLFLASEVMLFGGFFSAYVFLRLGADYPWPERSLPVLPGLINTFILIASSVTVVFAWAALKMRQWRQFQVYMGITIACAVIFMVLKGVEYNVKFHHQGVRLNDFSVVEGHLGYEKENGEKVKDHNGDYIEENRIRIQAEAITFSVLRYHRAWVEDIISAAEHQGSEIFLSEDVLAVQEEGGTPVLIAEKGEPLSAELLNRVRRAHVAARSYNAKLRTGALRQEWVVAKQENPDKKGWELATDVNIDMEALSPRLLTEVSTVPFEFSKPTLLLYKPRDVREGAEQSRLRDDTTIIGKMESSPMVFHNIDAIDFQHLVMKAEEKGISAEDAIESSWLMQNSPFVRQVWEWHLKEVEEIQETLIDRYGYEEDENGDETTVPKRVPTHKEMYRVGWKQLAEKGEEVHGVTLSATEKLREQFMGPNYAARGDDTFPELVIPREEVRFAAKFSPAWNTYYAIYFTMTGLHGLHVVGGALVLAYYLFFGRKMYLENPEWLCNRVEVGGLFWHFVDLVWIFVFPVLYLM